MRGVMGQSGTLTAIILIFLFLLGTQGVATDVVGTSNDQIDNDRSSLVVSNRNVYPLNLIDQQQSIIRSEQQAQADPDPSIPRPRPSGTIEVDSEEITLEESFKVTVRVENSRGNLPSQPAGAPSLISVSFPYLDKSDDFYQVEIIDHNFPENSSETEVVARNGDSMMHADGTARSIEYVVAEVVMTEGKWEAGETRFMTVEVTPRNPGEFKINARARLFSHESVAPPKRSTYWPPADAGHRGQQLYSVQHRYIDVYPSSSTSPTPEPTPSHTNTPGNGTDPGNGPGQIRPVPESGLVTWIAPLIGGFALGFITMLPIIVGQNVLQQLIGPVVPIFSLMSGIVLDFQFPAVTSPYRLIVMLALGFCIGILTGVVKASYIRKQLELNNDSS